MKRAAGSQRSNSSAERLQKVLAVAGLGSRRQCEELIVAGRVEVDGRVVTELGTRVDPAVAKIRVDGVMLRRPRLVYYAVNKPVGVVSTNADPAGRMRVIDLVPETRERLFTVGRLDKSSEGLMLVTNDGELANRLAHPRYGIHKTYLAVVAGQPTGEVLDSLRQGVRLAEGMARVVSVTVRTQHAKSTQLEIVLAEGKNREIRRILAKVGHKVLQLKRVALGTLKLGEMHPGECRRLDSSEVERLQAVAHGRPPRHRKRPVQSKRKPPQAAGPSGRSKLGRAKRPARTVIGLPTAPADKAQRPAAHSKRPATSRPGSAPGKRPGHRLRKSGKAGRK